MYVRKTVCLSVTSFIFLIVFGWLCVFVFSQIQGSIRPHAIIILPNSAGTEVLVCYEDEGVYIDTYGRITKDTVLQWGEMPASVGKFHSESPNIVSLTDSRFALERRELDQILRGQIWDRLG